MPSSSPYVRAHNAIVEFVTGYDFPKLDYPQGVDDCHDAVTDFGDTTKPKGIFISTGARTYGPAHTKKGFPGPWAMQKWEVTAKVDFPCRVDPLPFEIDLASAPLRVPGDPKPDQTPHIGIVLQSATQAEAPRQDPAVGTVLSLTFSIALQEI